MPKIIFRGQELECELGANLRQVLMAHGLPLYHPVARVIHCRGLGTCGTCAVKIEGTVSEMTGVERWRLNFPPHHAQSGLRLACQCKVMGDLRLEKWKGLWGNRH
jgi:ferredoxin